MNNFKKMKESLTSQIMDMTEEQLYEFLACIEENNNFSGNDPLIKLDDIFTCEKCERIYGCEETSDEDKESQESQECLVKFKKYCREIDESITHD